MNPRRQRFDDGVIVGTLSGGIVSVFTGAVQINTTATVVGLAPVIFALFYALFIRYRNGKQAKFEQTWEENRKSVMKFFLSIIDDDVANMKMIFKKLESKGFDFSKESNQVSLEDIDQINSDIIKERSDKLPPLKMF